jgi:hypothetical protein
MSRKKTKRLQSPFRGENEARAEAVVGALFGDGGLFSDNPKTPPGACWGNFSNAKECDQCSVGKQCAAATVRVRGFTVVGREQEVKA